MSGLPTNGGSRPRRVLLIRLSSIGDVVHALPAFSAIRASWPDCQIGWAVERAAAPLLRQVEGLVVHEIDVQGWRGAPFSPSTWAAVRRQVGALRAFGYDVAIDLQGLWKSALLGRVVTRRTLGLADADLRERGARVFYRYQAEPLAVGTQAVRRGLHLAAAAGAELVSTPVWPDLVRDPDRSEINVRLGGHAADPPILLHSAANWASKRYPDEHWVQVGRGLHLETGREVLWLWGPGEGERARSLAARAGAGNSAEFETDLRLLPALIRASALLVGGDSAPLHLAIACGTPVVGLFGPTDPRVLGPPNPADVVVVKRLECSHCHKRTCPLGTNECLDTVAPEEIVRAAITRLDRAG